MNSQAATQKEIKAGIKSLVYVALGIQSHTIQAQQVKALFNISFAITTTVPLQLHTMCLQM